MKIKPGKPQTKSKTRNFARKPTKRSCETATAGREIWRERERKRERGEREKGRARQQRVLVLQRSSVCKGICNLWAALHSRSGPSTAPNPFPSFSLFLSALPLFAYFPSLLTSPLRLFLGFLGEKKVACKRKCLQNEVAT